MFVWADESDPLDLLLMPLFKKGRGITAGVEKYKRYNNRTIFSNYMSNNVFSFNLILRLSFFYALYVCSNYYTKNCNLFFSYLGLTRPTIYPFPTSQYTYSMLSPEMPQVASW